LLLHGFVENDTGVVAHLIKLINAADTAVRENESATFQHELLSVRILSDVDGETNSRTSLSRSVDTTRGNLMNVLK